MKNIILLFCFGLVLHQTKRLSDHAPHGWRNLTEHAVGGVGIFAAWPHVARDMGLTKEQAKIGQNALAMVLLCLGGGVVFGWIADTLFRGMRK